MKRYATAADYKANKKFISVRVQVDMNGIQLSEFPQSKIRYIEKSNEYRFGPFGRIENVALGELSCSSQSTYAYVGNVIDYAENIEDVMKSAAEEGWKIRDKFINSLQKQLDAMKAVTVHRDKAV